MTYAELAERYNVNLCQGECGWGSSIHTRGMVWDKALHWRDRRVQRNGLYKFLKLVAQYHREGAGKEEAAAVHAVNSFAYRTALHDLGIRFPRAYSAEDRARVRFLLRGKPWKPNRRLHEWAASG